MCQWIQLGEREKGRSTRKGKLGLLEAAISNCCPDLKARMSPDRGPAHLTLLVHADIDQAFGQRTRYRLVWPISLTVIDSRRRVLHQLDLEIADQYLQALELMAGVSKPRVLLQLTEHVSHRTRRLPDIAAPKEMPKPRHINGDSPKKDVQIVDVPEAFPCLFNMAKPDRQMESVEDMRHGRLVALSTNALQPDVSVTENNDPPAR